MSRWCQDGSLWIQMPFVTVRPVATAGWLTLNAKLLDLPTPLGEFVIVHELASLLAPNHGKVFKSFMSAYLPDWEERQEMLRGYGRD